MELPSTHLGSIMTYVVPTLHICLSFEHRDAPPLAFAGFVRAILSSFHA